MRFLFGKRFDKFTHGNQMKTHEKYNIIIFNVQNTQHSYMLSCKYTFMAIHRQFVYVPNMSMMVFVHFSSFFSFSTVFWLISLVFFFYLIGNSYQIICSRIKWKISNIELDIDDWLLQYLLPQWMTIFDAKHSLGFFHFFVVVSFVKCDSFKLNQN